MVAGEVGAAFETVQHEGDTPCFESSAAVPDALLEEGAAASELRDLGFDKAALLLKAAVSDDFSVGFPVGQLVGCFCKGVEPSGSPSEELEEPGPHRVGGDA